MSEEAERDDVDRVAREWRGTPFHDHGEVKGPAGGVDCAKLLKCVFVEVGQVPDFTIPHYSPQFFLHRHREDYLSWVTKFAHEVAEDQVRHGDVVVYKIGRCFAHGAIVVRPGWPNIIHAHYRYGRMLRGDGRDPQLGTKVLDRKFFSRW